MGFECQSNDFKSISADNVDMKDMLDNPQLRGVKRKLDEEECPKSLGYADTQQRQSIFNISIYKLSRFRQVADPCLLQSVLVCNTLRHIERELEQDGIKPTYEFSNMALMPNSSNQTVTLNSSSNSLHSSVNPESLKCYLVSSVVTGDCNSSANNEYDKYLQELDSWGRKTPFIRTTHDKMDTGALYYDENDRLTSLNWSSVLNFNSLRSCVTSLVDDSYSSHTDSDSCLSEFNPSLHTLMPPASISSVNNSVLPSMMLNFTNSGINNGNHASTSTSSAGPSTNSSGDEIFGDVDLALYDFDLLSPLSPPNLKMAPVTAEELIKSIASNNETALYQPGSMCKQEHLNEDYDFATTVK